MTKCYLFIPFLLLHLISIGQGVGQILDKADAVYDQNPAESFSLCELAERRANESGDHHNDADISLCKARYYILIAKYDAASNELNRAILLFEKKNDLHNLAAAFKLKSILLERIGEDLEAHKMLLKSLDIYRKLDDNDGIIGALLNLSLDYERFEQPDSMLICLQDLQKRMKNSDPGRYYYYYQNWGSYYLLIKDYERAIQQLLTALKVAEEEKMTDSKATCLMLLSQAYQLNGELSKADLYAEESYQYSEQNNLIYESFEALEQWIKVKESIGDIVEAYDIQKKWIRVGKEINDLERLQKVNQIEAQLELAEKEKKIAEGEIALQRSNLEGQKARTRIAWLVGVVLIVIVLLFFAVLIYIRTRKLNATIQEQKNVVELKSLHLQEALNNIEDSLHYSKMIQSSMLPARHEFEDLFSEHFIFYKPKDIVSGDFYWLHKFDEYVVLAVGDCTGHGVPGAMVSMVCHEALNKVLIEQSVSEPAQALNKVRDIISRTFKRNDYEMSDGMDLALVMIDQNKLKFAGANNNVWICRDKHQTVVADAQYLKASITDHCQFIELKGDKQPIGHYYKPFPFVQKEIPLLKGDSVILFSDGYADQFGGEKGKKLKVSNLKTLIANAYKLELKDLGTHLEKVFDEWKGELEQIDDICVIGVRMQ